MNVFVKVCKSFGLTVSEKKTQTMVSGILDKKITVTGGEQTYKQVNEFVYLGSLITNTAEISGEISRRHQIAQIKMRELKDTLTCSTSDRLWMQLKVMLFKTQVVEVLIYGCGTWCMKATDYKLVTKYHRNLLHRITGNIKSARDPERKRLISYRELLELTKCESIETTIRRRRLVLAGHIVRLEDDRLTRQIALAKMEGGKPSRGSPATWWTCLSDDLKKFGIPKENWIDQATCEKEWLERVEGGAAPFMEGWKLKELEKQRNRMKARAKAETTQELLTKLS